MENVVNPIVLGMNAEIMGAAGFVGNVGVKLSVAIQMSASAQFRWWKSLRGLSGGDSTRIIASPQRSILTTHILSTSILSRVSTTVLVFSAESVMNPYSPS